MKLMLRYAVAATVAVILLNLLLRSLVKVGGVFGTLVIALLVAIGLTLGFAWREGRHPTRLERWQLNLFYAAILGVLYLGLLVMMAFQQDPGFMAVALFVLHYLSYPVLMWIVLARPWAK
ncbi:hypothetical protein [Pseudomonas sp. LRF_L74]|uniref:hypothetical protein n=1 Tax=Pseudomonas sp. LRF_L74 TaxID=3369422 RepID=UPI003F63FA78